MNNPLVLEQNLNWPHTTSNHVDHIALTKPFNKDRRLPLSGVDKIIVDESVMEANNNINSGDNGFTSDVSTRKIQALEKSMEFLKKEHKETLSSLQTEIERLKKENNDLQFKTIMLQSGEELPDNLIPVKKPVQQSSQFAKSSSINQKTTQLESEVRDLRSMLEEQVKRGHELQQLYDKQAKELEERRTSIAAKAELKSQHSSKSSLEPLLASKSDASLFNGEIDLGGVRFQFNPLRLRSEEDVTLKEPTLSECESIIKIVLQSNMQLNKEIQSMKDKLAQNSPRSAVHAAQADKPISSVIQRTPVLPPIPGGIATKPAFTVGSRPSSHRLISPRTSKNQSSNLTMTTSSGASALPFVPRDAASLPALRQTVGTKVAERKRKTEAIQKRRLEELEKFNKK